MAPPVLIPNTAVKRSSGDDSHIVAKVACRQNRGFKYAKIKPMNSWAQKRRLIYGFFVGVVLLMFIGIPAWKIFYRAPTCFDGIQNGKEQGIDCGGGCTKLCPSAFLSPTNKWVRFEETAPGLYNIAAYIINPNAKVGAFRVPYHVDVYDSTGVLITKYEGTFTLPANRNTVAFKSLVNVGHRSPGRAAFTFTAPPDWIVQPDRVKNVLVLDKIYKEEADSSTLSVTLKNTGVESVGRLSVYAILYDVSGNAVGFSATVIDGIAAGKTAIAPFTWNKNRNGSVVSIEVLPVAE